MCSYILSDAMTLSGVHNMRHYHIMVIAWWCVVVSKVHARCMFWEPQPLALDSKVKGQRLMHIKPENGKAYTKPNTTIMLLIILGVFKDLQTAVNERVYNIVWVMKRCVGESVMMEIGHIHLGSAKVTDVWLELWSG